MFSIFMLILAIISEVFGSTMLKKSEGFKKLWPSLGLVVSMVLAFYFLSLAIQVLSIGTVYAMWAGVGTALTTLVGIIIFKEPYNNKKIIGIILIIVGVVALKLSTSDVH